MSTIIIFVVFIALVLALRHRRHDFDVRRWRERVRKSKLTSKETSRKASIEEFRRGKEERRAHFVQSGLMPLYIALWSGLIAYLLAMISAVFYYWQQAHLLGWLVMPVLLLAFWSLSSYVRNQFRSNAFLTAFTLLLDYHHLMSDGFRLAGSLARVAVVVFALIIYAKMKDPVVSKV